MTSLSDRLKSLGVKVGTKNLDPTPPRPAGHSIDSVVAGSFHSTPRGDAFIAEQIFGQEHLHGKTSPYSEFPLSLISQWANDPRIAEMPIGKFA
ncbi:MAG: hypothetical protein HYZ23_05835, partial [Chloroflexi bacterium]|nr:hypothetical protein [Chloroflexota bacterium]